MDSKYVLLALTVACSQNLVNGHILPPSRLADLPTEFCVKTLTRHILQLCATYGDYQSEIFFDNGMPLAPREVAHRRWEVRDRVIEACCSRPCSAAELFSIC